MWILPFPLLLEKAKSDLAVLRAGPHQRSIFVSIGCDRNTEFSVMNKWPVGAMRMLVSRQTFSGAFFLKVINGNSHRENAELVYGKAFLDTNNLGKVIRWG